MLEQEHPTLEFRCLLLCARTHLSPAAINELHDLGQQNIDFELLCEIAIRHKVEQLLYRTLDSQVTDMFPRDYLIPLRERCEKAFSRNLALAENLVVILEQLNSHGIAAIPYKGPVLTQQVYGDLALRRYFDLDVFVHPKQYALAKKMFESQGYALTAESAADWECTYARKAMTPPVFVDLHRTVMPPFFSVHFDFKRLEERLTTIRLLPGRNVVTLSPEDLLLVLSAHASKPVDCWKKLRYICDIAELLRRHGKTMDWSWVFRAAKELDVYRMTLLGVHLSSTLLGVELPKEVSEQGKLPWLPGLKDHIVDFQLQSTTIDKRNEIYAHPEFYFSLRESMVSKFPTLLLLSRRALSRASATKFKDLQSIQFPQVLYPVYFIALPLKALRRHLNRIAR